MFLRLVYDDALAQAAYLVGCQRTGEAIVIDPLRDIDRYERLAAANGLRLVAAAETHIHADFLSGSRELAAKGGRAYLSAMGGPEWTYAWPARDRADAVLLRDADTFRVGGIEFTAVHTPGHTPEHICFLVTDRGGGADRPLGLFSGDFLFVGDVGRPDLLETAAGYAGQADASARALYQSLKKALAWPDYLQVWPGHGAGSACGKALGAVPQSTVGYERLFNPALRAADESAFIASILEGQPEPPLYFARMKRDNRDGPALLGGTPRPERLVPEALARFEARAGALIDTRPWASFKAGHLPRSLWIPVNNSFPTDAGSLVGAEEPITLIVDAARLDDALRALARVGLDRVIGWAPPEAVDQSGVRLVKAAEVSAAEAAHLRATTNPHVLDVRRAVEFAEGHLPGALHCSHTRLLDHIDTLPRDKPVLVNCRSGGRSGRACALLRKHGIEAINLGGGYLGWQQGGQPTAR